MLGRGLLRCRSLAGRGLATTRPLKPILSRWLPVTISSRGMAKAAGDAKAAAAAPAKADAKAPAAPAAGAAAAAPGAAPVVAKKKVLKRGGPKVFKGQSFAPDDWGPNAALLSRFPAPPPVPEPVHPDDQLTWRTTSAAVLERLPLKPREPTALEAEWQAELDAVQSRVVPRYKAPAAAASVKSQTAALATAASGEEGEGEGPGWGNDEEDEDEKANRAREAIEAMERDPVRRAQIDKDTKNIRRHRTEKVYLVVKKARKEHAWQFPQGGYDEKKDENSLRATAERELVEECGTGLHAHPMGNAPIGALRYKYADAAVRKKFGADGAAVFYHHLLYLEGDVKLDTREVVDYAWATKHELVTQYFKDSPDLAALTQRMLR